MNKKKNEKKDILIQSFKARQMLYLSGFITDKESSKINERLNKYKERNKITVTTEELL